MADIEQEFWRLAVNALEVRGAMLESVAALLPCVFVVILIYFSGTRLRNSA